MQLLMLLLLIVFSMLILLQFRKILSDRFINLNHDFLKLKKRCDDLKEKSELHDFSITKLKTSAHDIFTLYDLTKDLTKSLTEDDVVNVFISKLRDYMKFDDCRVLSHHINLESFSEYETFPIRSHRKTLGNLAVKGLSDFDKERMNVLLSQLALHLRRVRLYEEIEHLAISDSLTQLFTRRYFMERYNEEIQRAKKYKLDLSFLMLDVDNFKSINDRYGHLSGDVILREVAEIIKENIREIDLAGRYGGEEFSVVLTDTAKGAAKLVAERICTAVSKKQIKTYDEKFSVTISIGIATFPEDSKNPEEFIDKADWSLYRAKKLGKNQVCIFGHYQQK